MPVMGESSDACQFFLSPDQERIGIKRRNSFCDVRRAHSPGPGSVIVRGVLGRGGYCNLHCFQWENYSDSNVGMVNFVM